MNKRFLFRKSLENSLTILLIVAGVIILACFKVRPMDSYVAWCLAGVALLAIVVCIPVFLSRKDFLLFDSEGIHFSEKGRRTDLPWDQIRKCYFEMGPQRGLRDYYPLYLAVKMKDGEKVLIRLNGRFRGTIKKWRAAIEQSCSSRKVFDKEKSTSEVNSQVFVLIIVVLLVFSFFLLFSSCQERGGAIMRGPEAVRDSSCIQFTNEAFSGRCTENTSGFGRRQGSLPWYFIILSIS